MLKKSCFTVFYFVLLLISFLYEVHTKSNSNDNTQQQQQQSDNESEEMINSSSESLLNPIDISSPFTFYNPKLEFHYNDMHTLYELYNNSKELILEGDFGYMKYENEIYVSNCLEFYAPSAHTFSGHRFPLEMQIINKNSKGDEVRITVLFKYVKGEYSPFLADLGFDNHNLPKQKPLERTIIKNSIDVSKFIKDGKDFFMYLGNRKVVNTSYSNEYDTRKSFITDISSINLVLCDIVKVSKTQLQHFPEIVRAYNKEGKVYERKSRPIYRTFRMKAVNKIVDKVKSKVHKMNNQEAEQKSFNKQAKNAPTAKAKSTTLKAAVKKSTAKTQEETQEEDTKDAKDIKDGKDTTKTDKNTKEKEETKKECKKTNNLKISQVKDIVKEIENEKKIDQPDFIDSSMVKPSSHTDIDTKTNTTDHKKLNAKHITKIITMIIDKEIPDSECEEKRVILEKKFKLWKALYKKSLNHNLGIDSKHTTFIQLQKVQKQLLKSKYEPFVQELFNKQSEESSFLVVKENKMIKKANKANKSNTTPTTSAETPKKVLKEKIKIAKTLPIVHYSQVNPNQISQINKNIERINQINNLENRLSNGKHADIIHKNKIHNKPNTLGIKKTFDSNDTDRIVHGLLSKTIESVGSKLKELDDINRKSLYLDNKGYLKISELVFSRILQKAYDICSSNTNIVDYNLDLKMNEFTEESIIEYCTTNINYSCPDMTSNIIKSLSENFVSKNDLPKAKYSDIRNMIYNLVDNLPVNLTCTKKMNEAEKLVSKTKSVEKKVELDKEANGMGRKAKSIDGCIDETEIFDTSKWPVTCK